MIILSTGIIKLKNNENIHNINDCLIKHDLILHFIKLGSSKVQNLKFI